MQNKVVQTRLPRTNWSSSLSVSNKSFWNVRSYFVDKLINTFIMLNTYEKLLLCNYDDVEFQEI